MEEQMKNNIVLIGYMGSGKSTIGKKLSVNLGFEFVDTDHCIEAQQDCTISEIFATQGEAYFRELETQYLKKSTETLHEAVVSTGGGIVLREENVKLLQEIGFVIYLRASQEVIYQRVKKDTTRPLLQCENPQEAIAKMLEQRGPIYESAANLIVDTNFQSVDEVVAEIIEQLAQRNLL